MVIGLLYHADPFDVAWLVIAIVIGPVKSVLFGWSPAYVCDEGREVSAPLIAHGDASASVVLVAHACFTEASIFSCSPNAIFGGF